MTQLFNHISQTTCPHCQREIKLDSYKPLEKCDCPHCGGKLTVPAAFSEYTVYERIQSGRFSSKYKAYNKHKNRPVILKVVNADAQKRVKEALIQHHQKLATLSHPNIAVIHRVGEIDSTYFIEEENLLGSLRDVIYAEKALAEVEALSIARDVASALSLVHHQLDINHLNLNPKSIRLNESGHPKVCDFSHHRVFETDRKLIGVPKYVSPEAILFATSSQQAPEPGHQADIFSLGVILYRLLSKQSPYSGDPMKMIKARFTDKPKPLSECVTSSSGTVAIVERMMALKLTDRYGTMMQVFEHINDHIAQLSDACFETRGKDDFEIDLVDRATYQRNADSGPHVINQNVLSKAVNDLFQAGALEYAAPADESRNSVSIDQKENVKESATQKIERVEHETKLPMPKKKLTTPKEPASAVNRASEMDLLSEVVRTNNIVEAQNSSFGEIEPVIEVSGNKIPLWGQLLLMFIMGMAGAAMGIFVLLKYIDVPSNTS